MFACHLSNVTPKNINNHNKHLTDEVTIHGQRTKKAKKIVVEIV